MVLCLKMQQYLDPNMILERFPMPRKFALTKTHYQHVHYELPDGKVTL